MKFTKMHGIGNDYVYVNCFKETVKDPSAVAKFVKMCIRDSVNTDLISHSLPRAGIVAVSCFLYRKRGFSLL